MIKKESGFTLIEMIVVLVLAGILSAIVAMGFVTGIKGYIFAREMAPTSQKATLAMSRLSREMMEMFAISSATPNSINFTNLNGSWIVAVDAGVKTITLNGDILIDNVNSFTLTYSQSDGSAWTTSNDMKLLSAITIGLTVNRTDGGSGTIVFTTVVNPRNTGNFNAPIG